MGLGLPSGGGGADRTPVIKYDARAGRLFRVDRANVNGRWETTNVEITSTFRAVVDLDNIEIGWIHFPSGAGPSTSLVPHGSPLPQQPTAQHRPGFRLLMKLGKECGGDVREMLANALVIRNGMDALFDEYVAHRGANPGKLPIVSLEKTVPVKSTTTGPDGKQVDSTNYQPVFKVEGWVARPADLAAGGGVHEVSREGPGNPAPRPPQDATPPPPPPPAAQPQPAMASADGEEF